jgi:N6-adenosine-specific RNA methylase IME4
MADKTWTVRWKSARTRDRDEKHRGPARSSLRHWASSVIEAPPREHLWKPDNAYDVIEGVFPTLEIDMSARGPARPDWHVWRNEADPQECSDACVRQMPRNSGEPQ